MDGHLLGTNSSFCTELCRSWPQTFTFPVRWAWYPLLTFMQYESTTQISIFLSMLWNAESWCICTNSIAILLSLKRISADDTSKSFPHKEVSNQFTGDIIQVSLLMLMSAIFCRLKWGRDRLQNHIAHPLPLKQWHFNSSIPLVCNW